MSNSLDRSPETVSRVADIIGSSFKLINQGLINSLAEEASQKERLRQHYKLSATQEEKVQRFLNALQMGTYVRPHRHPWSAGRNRFELFVVLQGSLGILLFDDRGEIIHQERLNAQGQTCGIELKEGSYHTVVVLSPNTVMLEIKEGPYDPQTHTEFLSTFPLEGTVEAENCVQLWESYFICDEDRAEE